MILRIFFTFLQQTNGNAVKRDLCYDIFDYLKSLLFLSYYSCIEFFLKGYCTVFQHALKSLEIAGIILS